MRLTDKISYCFLVLISIPILLLVLLLIYLWIDYGIPRLLVAYESEQSNNIQTGCLSVSGVRGIHGKTFYEIRDTNNQRIAHKSMDDLLVKSVPAYQKYYFTKHKINHKYGYCNPVKYIQIDMGKFFGKKVFLYDF